MKKINKIEIKIYELLGIKIFRKLAFKLRDTLCSLFILKLSHEERHSILYNSRNNYTIGKIESLEDIKSFKKELYKNSAIHLICIISLLMIGHIASLGTIINIYCIMLQRYNYIRINKVIEKMQPKYEKKLQGLKEELIKEDSLLLEHSYKIIDKKDNQKEISFEELINNASYKELNYYKERLEFCKLYNKLLSEQEIEEKRVIINLKKNKNKKLYLVYNPTKK